MGIPGWTISGLCSRLGCSQPISDPTLKLYGPFSWKIKEKGPPHIKNLGLHWGRLDSLCGYFFMFFSRFLQEHLLPFDRRLLLARPLLFQNYLGSQLFEELQSHSGLDDPHPETPLILTRFRPEFDPILTPNRPESSELGQNRVRKGVQIGSERLKEFGGGDHQAGLAL